MKMKNKRSRNKNIRNLILMLISVILLLEIVIIGGHSNKNSDTAVDKPTMQPLLNMAIVNEDNGVIFRNQSYDLGKAYVSQLHNGKHLNYTVVPRSIAEAGLKRNDYQLVIFIPSDFSQKIVDLNNPDPSKLDVQYKINAKTPAMKNRCQQEANHILQDLNERLIDIYTLGIMGNLYNAQQQVNGIYHRQGNLAGAYQTQLFSPISAFSQAFPDLQSNTKDALQINHGLQKDIQQSAQSSFQDNFNQLNSANNSLMQLIQAQSQSDHNQVALIKKLMTINQQAFNEQTQAFIKNIQQANQALTKAAQTTANQTSDTLVKQFTAYANTYTQEIKTLNQSLAQQKQQQTQQDQAILAKLHQQYGVDGNAPLTLGDFIKQNQPTLYDNLVKQAHDVTALQQQYAQLPFAQMPASVQAVLSNADKNTINQALQQINQANQTLNHQLSLSGSQQLQIKGNQSQMAQFNNLHNATKHTPAATQAITLPNINNMQGDTLTLQLPVGVTVDQQALRSSNVQVTQPQARTYQLKVEQNNGNVTLPLRFDGNSNGQTLATLTYQTVQPQVTANNHANTSSVTKQTRSFTLHFNLAEQMPSLKNASTKQQQLAELVGKWVAYYTDAATTAQNTVQRVQQNNINQVLAIPLDQPLQSLLSQVDAQNLQNEQQALQKINDNEKQMAQQKATYLQTLATISNNSRQNIKTAQTQLASLQALQTKFAQLQQASPTNAPDESHIAAMQALAQQLQSLAQNTRALQSTINNDTQQFNGVYANFDQLNNQLAQVQNGSKNLHNKSMNLQNAFKQELSRSGNFTQSFIRVLNAGYRNGVPNEKLLAFIANPIKGQSQVVVTAKTQSYSMTLWTLIITILALFMAYAMRNWQYFRKEQYFSRFKTRLSRQALQLGLLLGMSAIVGTIIAAVAQSQLPIIAANQLLWFVTVISMTMLTTLCAYLLLTYCGMLGMGILIAFFIIFIFVQVQSGTILTKFNVLDLISTPLLNVVMLQEQNVFLTLIMVVVLLIAGVLIGLFVPDKQSEVMNNAS